MRGLGICIHSTISEHLFAVYMRDKKQYTGLILEDIEDMLDEIKQWIDGMKVMLDDGKVWIEEEQE